MDLICPHCRRDLEQINTHLRCVGCQSKWPLVNGVPHFVSSSDYWGEIGLTQEISRQIIQEMQSRNWEDVIRTHASPVVRKYYGWMCDMNRVSWHRFLDLKEDSVVLDLGAGFGTISYALSRYYRRVYAVEKVEERLEFMRLRFGQEGCKNIALIRTDIDLLPFRENFFDLIILNGVLEWLPYNRRRLNPRRAQLEYLEALRGLLKPSGTLYVGIENRMSYDFWLGAPDPHIWIKYVTVLPRWISDLVCKLKVGDRFRPYVYSHLGYKKLLKDAGYRDIEIFSVSPSYHDPKAITSLKNDSSQFADTVWVTKNPLSKLVRKIMVRMDMLKYFGPAYIIFARQ